MRGYFVGSCATIYSKTRISDHIMKILTALLLSVLSLGRTAAGPSQPNGGRYGMPKVVSTNDCPVKGTHFLPNPSDCSYYFICNNGVYTMRQCAAGLIFDLLSNNCNYPDQSVCITEAQPTNPQQPPRPVRPSTQSPGRDNNSHLTAPTPSGMYVDRQKTAGTPPPRWHY